jgi:hypothetical protein
MLGTLPGAAAALWLGILTSISPCPLATNVAAVSYVGRHVGEKRKLLLAAGGYVVGRSLAYAIVGGLVVWGLLNTPGVSTILQRHMNQVLGPVLVVAGMVVVGLIDVPFSTSAGTDEARERAAKGGVLGAVALGGLFALSFCPVSAALFFGSLIPLSASEGSAILLPVLYGVGTGIPVLAVAVPLALGVQAVGSWLGRIETVELWSRRVTGVAFIAVGLYYSVRFIFLT